MRHLLQREVRGFSVAELLIVGALVVTCIAASSWGLSGVIGQEESVQLTKARATYGEYITDPNEAFVPQP